MRRWWGGRPEAAPKRPLCPPHALQLIRPINALDELCRLMKSLVHPKPGAGGSLGAGLIPVSSELCYRLGACQIAMCGTGMQRWAAAVGGLGSQRGCQGKEAGRPGPSPGPLLPAGPGRTSVLWTQVVCGMMSAVEGGRAAVSWAQAREQETGAGSS